MKVKRFLVNDKTKLAQIWVETAIYTLIGLSIIGVVLAIATPAIERYKDGTIVEQTISVLNDLNEKIIDARDAGAGNKRVIPELRIKKGKLELDCGGNKIIYTLEESRLEYSESGQEVKQGDITIKTEKNGRKYDITLTLSYDDVDLTYNGKDEKKTFQAATTPYKLSVENNGAVGDKIQIAIAEIS